MHINGGTSGKESTCQWRRRRRQGKIPWRRAWQPTPVVLPGKFHGQRSLAGYSPRDCKESDVTEHIHIEIRWCLSNWLKGHFKNSFIDLFLLCWIFFNFFIFYFIYFLNFILFFNFTILYWFCHISKWIHHRYNIIYQSLLCRLFTSYCERVLPSGCRACVSHVVASLVLEQVSKAFRLQ